MKSLASNAQGATTTSPTGSYVVVGLQPGTYEVSVASGQFKPYTSNIEVTVGGHATLDAQAVSERRGHRSTGCGRGRGAGQHSGSPFSYYDFTNNYSGYNVARYTPDGPIPQHTFKSIPHGADRGGANLYQIGTLPGAVSWGNPNLVVPDGPSAGISDWGPWPTNMTGRNAFRGPGFWNLDLSVAKKFPIREYVNIEFRAEGFDILNHHNLFLQEATNDVSSNSVGVDALGNPTPAVLASKGGIANNGGANDERRFGQFALKVNF